MPFMNRSDPCQGESSVILVPHNSSNRLQSHEFLDSLHLIIHYI